VWYRAALCVVGNGDDHFDGAVSFIELDWLKLSLPLEQLRTSGP